MNESTAPPFLTSTLNGDVRSAWRPCQFAPGEIVPRRLGGPPEPVLDAVQQRRITCPCQLSNIGRRYTDWAIPAPNILIFIYIYLFMHSCIICSSICLSQLHNTRTCLLMYCDCLFGYLSQLFITVIYLDIYGARGSVVGWGTMLQVGMSRVRFPTRSMDFSVDRILPATLRPWGQLSL
jgi:hypothetical protein